MFKFFIQLRPLVKYILAVTVQVVIILVIIIYKLSFSGTGNTILLQLKPIDATHAIKGSTVYLTYEISTLPGYNMSGLKPKVGDTVYVPLQKIGKTWQMSGQVVKVKPANSSITYIRGKIASVINSCPNCSLDSYDYDYNAGLRIPRINDYNNYYYSDYRIDYGIEGYYLDNDKDIKEAVSDDYDSCVGDIFGNCSYYDYYYNSYARVTIDESGQATLKKVYINNKPWP